MTYDKKEKVLYMTHEEQYNPELYWCDEEGLLYTPEYGPVPYGAIIFTDDEE